MLLFLACCAVSLQKICPFPFRRARKSHLYILLAVAATQADEWPTGFVRTVFPAFNEWKRYRLLHSRHGRKSGHQWGCHPRFQR